MQISVIEISFIKAQYSGKIYMLDDYDKIVRTDIEAEVQLKTVKIKGEFSFAGNRRELTVEDWENKIKALFKEEVQ